MAANDYVTCWVLSTTAHIAIARGNGDDALRDAELAVALVDGRAGRVPAMAQARLAVIRRALGNARKASNRCWMHWRRAGRRRTRRWWCGRSSPTAASTRPSRSSNA